MISIRCFYGGTIAPKTITGGDRHGLEVWSAWSARSDCALHVHASYWGRELIEAFGYSLQVVPTESVPSIIGSSRLGYFRRFINALAAALRVDHPNVVYSASPYFYDLLPSVALKLRSRARLAVSLFHLIPPPWKRAGSPIINTAAWIEQRCMVWFVKQFADRVVVDNQELVDELTRMGIRRENIILTPMGIRELPSVDGKARSANERRFDAIYVGRLSAPKGVPGLITAWSDVQHRVPGATLALVGNNEVAFDAERLIREAGLERLISVFSGLDDAQVRASLENAEIFITGSLEEGYGLSVLEALAAGLPCVTFDIPAFREAFPVGRHPAKSYDYADLARAAAELLDDRELRESLRTQIRERIAIKTWPQVAAELWDRCVSG